VPGTQKGVFFKQMRRDEMSDEKKVDKPKQGGLMKQAAAEETGGMLRITVRVPKALYRELQGIASDLQQPLSYCLRELLHKGLAEKKLPTKAILRAQVQALSELIYITRGGAKTDLTLLEQAKAHAGQIVHDLFDAR
jgi:hypothetical protein